MLYRLTCILALAVSLAQTAKAAEPVDMNKRAEELKNLKWGMFICWSFSTFSGKEWTPGIKDASFFKATGCDTDQWAQTAKEAGMGYILFLTKHHDGFCLWDTKTTDRKVTKSPLGRDVLAELRKSCEKHGIKLALYFSEGDWNWPGAVDGQGGKGGSNPEMKKAQLKELLTQYGPVEYIWFDHAVGDGGLSHKETVAFCKSLQPGCFIGFNHGDQEGADIRLGEMGRPGPLDDHKAAGPHMRDQPSKSYLLAEFTYPILPDHKGGAKWFYSLPIHDNLCYPAEKLYADYLGAVKYGNVFALDAGPDYEGKLRKIDVETLRKVGQMIRDKAPEPDPAAVAAAVAAISPAASPKTSVSLTAPKSLSSGKKAKASSVWSADYAADKSFDDDDTSRWGAAPESRSGWIEVDLEKETEIGQAIIKEIGYPRTEQFVIEYKDGDAWKELVKGTAIAGERLYEFKPVKARYVRLNILKANEVPTIEEFQLYAPGTAKPTVSMEDQQKRDARLKWFHEAKYGFFINWGLYSIPAGEWKGKPIGGIGEWIMHNAKIPVKEYEQLAAQFNPVRFNAEEWIQLADDAGMKYVVFDCKHHDGFALFHSEISKYNCFDATPWKRDPMKELREACDRHKIKLCFYYSQATDWHEPNGANNTWDFAPNAQKDFDQYLRDKSLPQVKELLTNYGPIGLIWFDLPTLMTPERGKRFVDLVRSTQPDTLINSRLGPGNLHDYRSMGDNQIPNAVTPGAWETAATINDTWGYKKDDHKWKSPENITFKLVDIVSKGGNYLLNVGPMGDGFIPQESQDILRAVGKWLKVNGEAIYGAGPTPFGEELSAVSDVKKDKKGAVEIKSDWRCTTKPGKLYIHLFRWPQGKLDLAGVKGKVGKAYLLADPERKSLNVSQSEGKVSVSLPEKAGGGIATVVCVEVEG
ncbi:MAG: alpha-L-fucosidase [Candidatus Sumerlaeota bacterium]|nr:alpha-L-fucosidase [Candidatus Sumerlaeota bacterium]